MIRGADRLAVFASRGIDHGGSVYVGAHEAAHALDLGVTSMQAASVDRALMRLSSKKRLLAEAVAHAVARIVADRCGEPWARAAVTLTALGAIKNGDRWGCGDVLEQATHALAADPDVVRLADRVMALDAVDAGVVS